MQCHGKGAAPGGRYLRARQPRVAHYGARAESARLTQPPRTGQKRARTLPHPSSALQSGNASSRGASRGTPMILRGLTPAHDLRGSGESWETYGATPGRASPATTDGRAPTGSMRWVGSAARALRRSWRAQGGRSHGPGRRPPCTWPVEVRPAGRRPGRTFRRRASIPAEGSGSEAGAGRAHGGVPSWATPRLGPAAVPGCHVRKWPGDGPSHNELVSAT